MAHLIGVPPCTVDGGQLTLISAGLNALSLIVGFAILDAILRTLAFEQRPVFTVYRHGSLIGATTPSSAIIIVAGAAYTALVLPGT